MERFCTCDAVADAARHRDDERDHPLRKLSLGNCPQEARGADVDHAGERQEGD